MRYRFYREHKYVSASLNDLERLIAKTDFCQPTEIARVADSFRNLTEMLQGHAQYENEKLHTLLKSKGSHIFDHVEADHVQQDQQLDELEHMIAAITVASVANRELLGYKFYLAYRKFVADNLAHLHEEETIILPELQRLYTDDELREVEASTYRLMTPEDMTEMMQVLFPHMNPSDRVAFLSDIHTLQPDKFTMAWQGIASSLDEQERVKLQYQFLSL